MSDTHDSPIDLEACRRGDPAAWRQFVERYARVIHAAVQRTAGRRGAHEYLEDLTQQVFVRLVAKDYALLKRYDPQRATLSTWLTIVSRSVAIDHLRRQPQTTITLDEARDQPAPDTPDAQAEGLHLPEHLLSARQAMILRLLFDQGLEVDTIAAMLKVEAQTVRGSQTQGNPQVTKPLRCDAMNFLPAGMSDSFFAYDLETHHDAR